MDSINPVPCNLPVRMERVHVGCHDDLQEVAVPCLPEHRLTMHLSGSCRLEWDCAEESFRSRPFRSSITLIPAGRSGHFRVQGRCEVLKVGIAPQLMGTWAESQDRYKPGDLNLQVRYALTDGLLAHLLFALWRETEEPQTADRLYCDSLRNALAAHLVKYYSEATRGSDLLSRRYSLSESRSRRALEFMETHLADSIGLSDLARELGLSVSHFSAQFRRKFGQSPSQYLQSLRLERARHLLSATNRPVAEVALATGFENPSHFSQKFRRIYNLTPSAYRAGLDGKRQISSGEPSFRAGRVG